MRDALQLLFQFLSSRALRGQEREKWPADAIVCWKAKMSAAKPDVADDGHLRRTGGPGQLGALLGPDGEAEAAVYVVALDAPA